MTRNYGCTWVWVPNEHYPQAPATVVILPTQKSFRCPSRCVHPATSRPSPTLLGFRGVFEHAVGRTPADASHACRGLLRRS